jgi:DNA-binding response OmpR family regulator
VKALFFAGDESRVKQLALALRMRWPDVTVRVAQDSGAVVQALAKEEPDIVVLCGDIPGMDVWSAIGHTRRRSDVPILVAAWNASETDIVKALELGADEYIRMPVDLIEVMARVMALLRRVGITRRQSSEGPVVCGELIVNPATHEVFLGSNQVALTPTEFKLLYLLAKNRHVTVTQRYIQRSIWAADGDAAATLKKYIQRLRGKLGDDARNPRWIRTVRGVGYRLSVSSPTAA